MSSYRGQRRAKNFTGHEKTQLMEIIQKYAAIIENKKTDAVSVKDKNNCWERIKNEFNSMTTEGSRDVQCLKTFYQNSKRSLKKKRAENNKEAYISLLENKLDGRSDENVEEEETELQEALKHLESSEKVWLIIKETKRTGGGSYIPVLPTGADAILGELLADQLQPLENSFDDGAQYFGIDNIEPQNPSSAVPKRKKKRPVTQKNNACIKRKIYERKLFLVNLEIKQKQRLFQKELKLKDLEIRKAELELEKFRGNN